MKKSILKQSSKSIDTLETPAPPPSFYSCLHYLLAGCVLILGALALYWSTLHYAFHFDDLANIKSRFEIRHHTFADLFFSGTRWISYWLNALLYSFVQFDPFWYRTVDVLIHGINGFLIFFLLLFCLDRLKTDSWFKQHALTLSWLAALLFIIHPVQSQTICYVIQGQLEGLATLSILLLLLIFSLYAYTESMALRTFYYSALMIVSFIAVGTKEITIVAPFLMLILDWFFIAQGSWKKLKSRLLVHSSIALFIWFAYLYLLKPDFFFEVFGFTAMAKNNQGNIITASANEMITPFYWLISQFKVIMHYLFIFIWPFSISVEYDWKLVHSLFSLDFLFPLALCIGIFVVLWYRLKKDKSCLYTFGMLWFFISMGPRTSIIPSSELLVDYKTYVGSIGIFFILGSMLVLAYEKVTAFLPVLLRHPALQTVACICLIAPLSYATAVRQMVWSSGINFWADIMAKAPGKARAYNNYGVELCNADRYPESIPYFKKAIEMDAFYTDPLNNSAVAYAHKGEIDMAIQALEKSLKLNPLFAEGYNNIAGMYQKKGDLDNAEKALLKAVKIRPHYGKAWHNLGLLYVEKENMEQAWECFKTCCYKADLDDDMGFHAFAKASIHLKRYDHAIDAYHKLLKMQPHNFEAAFNLANVHYLAKNYDTAVSLYEQLLKTNPDDSRVIVNIGEAYYAKNEPSNALMYFQRLADCRKQIPSICVRMARCYKDLGDIKQARALLKEAYSLNLSVSARKQADEFAASLA